MTYNTACTGMKSLQGSRRFYRVAVRQAVILFHKISLAPSSRWSHGEGPVLFNDYINY